MTQPMTLTVARKAPRLTLVIGSIVVIALLVMPFLALLPASHPLAISTYTLTLIGKILCYAVVAVALDLVWGYAGLLSLGHGLFLRWAVTQWECISCGRRRGMACQPLCRSCRGMKCRGFGLALNTSPGRSA